MQYKRIGIICAMESEARGILQEIDGVQTEKIGFLTFFTGKIGTKEICLAVCGIGKVFAAVCAQTMILRFQPDCIINSGVAGSLTAKLSILDLAISSNLVQHDMDTSPLGDPKGMISGINMVKIPAEEALQKEVAKKAAELGINTLFGTIASGDQFIAKKEQKEAILNAFSPIACEMEGAAIAQVAYLHQVPFVVIRAISDSFDGKNEMDYAIFAEKAAQKGTNLLISLLKDEQ